MNTFSTPSKVLLWDGFPLLEIPVTQEESQSDFIEEIRRLQPIDELRKNFETTTNEAARFMLLSLFHCGILSAKDGPNLEKYGAYSSLSLALRELNNMWSSSRSRQALDEFLDDEDSSIAQFFIFYGIRSSHAHAWHGCTAIEYTVFQRIRKRIVPQSELGRLHTVDEFFHEIISLKGLFPKERIHTGRMNLIYRLDLLQSTLDRQIRSPFQEWHLSGQIGQCVDILVNQRHRTGMVVFQLLCEYCYYTYVFARKIDFLEDTEHLMLLLLLEMMQLVDMPVNGHYSCDASGILNSITPATLPHDRLVNLFEGHYYTIYHLAIFTAFYRLNSISTGPLISHVIHQVRDVIEQDRLAELYRHDERWYVIYIFNLWKANLHVRIRASALAAVLLEVPIPDLKSIIRQYFSGERGRSILLYTIDRFDKEFSDASNRRSVAVLRYRLLAHPDLFALSNV